MKKPKEREVLQDEAALTALDNSIADVQNQIDAVVAKRQAMEVTIASTPEGVANLKQFWKMKNMENSEQFLTKKLERLRFQKSLLEQQRNIPNRNPEDTFDEQKVVDDYRQEAEEEKLAKIRQNREREDKEHDR